ncbi:aldo/keto reductase [Clavibacter sp. MX14-G9D]|uniref:aldo/keto reductase n=1 Tax=Clavibacter sp. MX14-G9D TaxID=3064656 RepID=UPI00293E5976|nr:aldo/keto reductase [Clavibacter sp. MX14-G9D]
MTATPFLLGGDLPVNRIAFGAMRLAADGFTGPARDAETSRSVLRRAVELDIDLIDTAAFYVSDDGSLSANGLIREALHPYPDGLVIATKVGPSRRPDGTVDLHAPASGLRAQVEQNLRELDVPRLDVVHLRVGAMRPPRGESIGERFAALAALREEGLIRHLALSNVDAQHVAEARAIAPVVAVQNTYRTDGPEDAALLRMCEEAGIAFVPFFPLSGGMVDVGGEVVRRIAASRGITASQVALAWLIACSPVTLAIPGTGSVAHLEENTAARDVELSAAEVVEIADQ